MAERRRETYCRLSCLFKVVEAGKEGGSFSRKETFFDTLKKSLFCLINNYN